MPNLLDARFRRRSLADNTRRTYHFQAEHLGEPQTVRELAEALQDACKGRPKGTVRVRKAVAGHFAAAHLQEDGGKGALRDLLDDEFRIQGRETARVRGLDPEQLAAFSRQLASVPVAIALVLRIMVRCGLRISEARLLEWSDFHGREVIIRNAKGGHERAVPVPTGLLATLAEWRKETPGTLVFPGRGGEALSESGIWNHVRRIRQRETLLAQFHPHQLRHTFAEHLLAKGHSLPLIQALLGHVSIETTAVYARSSRAAEQAAVESILDNL